MKTNWDNIAWIFNDISFCVIYVQEATLDNWSKIITFLNENYSLVFNKYENEDFEPSEVTDRIVKETVFQFFNDTYENDYCIDASIDMNGLEIKVDFSLKDQIELYSNSDNIKSIDDYKKVEELMIILSKMFDKQVTLSDDGEAEFPLIKVDVTRGIIEAIDKEKYENRFYLLKYRIQDLYSKFLEIFFPKKHRMLWDNIHDDCYLSKKIKDNAW